MSSVSIPAEQRVVLDNIRWSTYEAILDDVDNRHGRITYDQGVLEIMSPSQRHERVKYWIRRLIDVATEELGVEVLGGCSTTNPEKLGVVTSTSLLTQIVERVGGDRVSVVNIISPKSCSVVGNGVPIVAKTDPLLITGEYREYYVKRFK